MADLTAEELESFYVESVDATGGSGSDPDKAESVLIPLERSGPVRDGSGGRVDKEVERDHYALSLFNDAQWADLKEEELRREKSGRTRYWTIEEVRGQFTSNSVKEQMDFRGETLILDPEMMLLIDIRTDYNIFVSEDNIYTREELLEAYPFEHFKCVPEDVFVQQEIGVFPPKKYAMEDHAGVVPDEYIARDVGDDSIDFVMIEDLVGMATRRGYKNKRAPSRIVLTKIYRAGDKWENFKLLKRIVHTFTTFAPAIEAAGGSFFTLPSTGSVTPGPLAIQDAEGVERERRRAEEAELRAREAELRAKEAELRAKEAELRWREVEASRIEERRAYRDERTAMLRQAREASERQREENSRAFAMAAELNGSDDVTPRDPAGDGAGEGDGGRGEEIPSDSVPLW